MGVRFELVDSARAGSGQGVSEPIFHDIGRSRKRSELRESKAIERPYFWIDAVFGIKKYVNFFELIRGETWQCQTGGKLKSSLLRFWQSNVGKSKRISHNPIPPRDRERVCGESLVHSLQQVIEAFWRQIRRLLGGVFHMHGGDKEAASHDGRFPGIVN